MADPLTAPTSYGIVLVEAPPESTAPDPTVSLHPKYYTLAAIPRIAPRKPA